MIDELMLECRKDVQTGENEQSIAQQIMQFLGEVLAPFASGFRRSLYLRRRPVQELRERPVTWGWVRD